MSSLVRFVVSGEGPTDVGVTTDTPGPLMSAVRYVAETLVGTEWQFEIVHKGALSTKSDKVLGKDKKSMRLRGAKKKIGFLVYLRGKATALARLAMDDTGCGAILFCDCDYTRHEVTPTMAKNYYQDVVRAIETGFREANDFRLGVPMVPRPRSESWFLCHYQKVPYSNTYEDLPANDEAERSGKHLLAKFFNCAVDECEIYSHVNPEEVAWGRVNAPSFVFFVRRLQNVAERMLHRSTTRLEHETSMDFAETHRLI